MKQKTDKPIQIDVHLELSEGKIQDVRKNICEEFAIKDPTRPDVGYQYNSRVCQQCALWSACMMIGYMSTQDSNHKAVKEHFNLKYFFDESLVLQEAENYVQKLVGVINKKLDEKDSIEEEKLDSLLQHISLDKLQTLDPEIPEALKFNILRTGKFKNKNGKITR